MAEKIGVFPRPSRRSKYDTRTWFDGNIWKLTQGTDFEVDVASFRGSLYNRAKLAGFEIRTTVEEDDNGRTSLVVQKIGNKEPVAPKPRKKTAAKK